MAGVPVTHGTVQTSDRQRPRPLVLPEPRAGSLDFTTWGRFQLATQSRDGWRSHRSLKLHYEKRLISLVGFYSA